MSQIETWYFSYGSNMPKQQMHRRTGSVPASRNAWLANYGLAFRNVLGGDDVYTTIVPLRGSIVHGVTNRCSLYAMAQLDLFEGVGENCYRREPVQVSTQNGEVLASTVNIGEAFSTEISIPNAKYLDSIVTGAEEHQLPTDCIEWIRSIATDSYGAGPIIY